MRTLFLSLLCLFGALTVLQAQDPGIAYQAVARDADGDPLADAELDVRVTLYGADAAVLWQENHASVLTNQFGNLALTIGDGAVTPGYNALSAVDWSAAGLHFGIEVDAGAGYASFGDVDVEAVPIAMYALNGQEEEIAALQTQLDALDGNVSALTSGLSDAITESVNQDAYLLGLIQDNDGDISVLQSSVAANTADLGDLLSVITVGTNGITVEDLNVTGDLDITGVFSAATGLFNYLSANNADFEDMIAEAAQVEQMTFFEGRALGANSSLDVDGTLNVDGAATLADLTINGEQAATQPYVDSADAVNAQAIQDEAATRANADNDLQGQIDANDGDIAALQSADLSLGQSIAANETAIAENASALAANAAADAAESAAGAAADADLAAADADLSAALAANAAADAAESAAGAAADAALAAYDAAQDSVSAVVVAQAYADLAANAAADAAESAAGSAADADLQGQITSNDAEIAQANSDISANAADVADNEFRIAASAADMGFVESTVGSVNNVPTHPGYDGANYVAADANMVAADMALDAALNSAQADIDQNEADGDTADADLAAALAANAAADATESAAGAAADAALAAYDAAQDSVSAVVVAQAYADLAANAAADAANATADAIESAAGAAADAALAAYDAAQDSVSAVVVAQAYADLAANAAADAAESAAGTAADAALAAYDAAQDSVSAVVVAQAYADLAANAAADAAESSAGALADADLQTQIDDNAASSVAADATLSGQILANDDDIALLDLQLEAEAQMRLIADINNQQQSQINANAIANEISDRTDADNALDAYDAYLLGLIEGTANTPLDVENILEGLDYFEHDGNTVSLEAPYNALEAGSMMASTASFNAMDAQDIDVDDAEIQNVTVETNIYSPAGTIDQMNSTDLTVYVSSDLQGAVSAGSTLDVSGETTLGADVSVTGDVTVSGNVTAADATAANHLASFGQMTTADQALQADIDGNELDSDNADDQLQTNIDANATADAAESLAGDVSDQEIQDDVDANQTASELADTNMQADIDGNELDSDNADDQLQTNIDANATADAAESLAGDVSDQEIQDDVDANQTASELADTNMQADIDQNELDSDNADAAIHDLLYWNLGEDTFDDTQMELTLDAGIDAIDLGNSDLYTDQVTASSVGAMNGNFTDLVSYDANIDQLGANEINAGTVIAQQVRWTDAIGWGTGSTTDLQGTLNVDGATTMAAITADGAANLQAGLNVDGATTMDDLMADGNVDFNGDLLDVDAATSVDISSPLIDLSADVEMDLSAPRVVVHTSDFDLEGPLDVNGFTELDGLNVDGATTMDAMTADGLVTVNGNADINGNADVSGTLGVGGDVTMSSNAQVTGDLNVDGATTVDEITADGDADINGDADVSGTLNAGASTLASATITGDASVGGNTTMTGDASVGGNATVTGTLNAGASTLASATVTGHTELDGGLNVDGATTMDGLTVDGDIDLNGSIDVMDVLDVHGRAYFNELVDVHQGIAFFDQPQGNTMYLAPSGDITSQGSISMDGNAMFGGNANVTGTLDVTGTSTLGVVNAGATSTTTLTATGAAQLGDGLNVDGATTMDQLTANGDVLMDGVFTTINSMEFRAFTNTVDIDAANVFELDAGQVSVDAFFDITMSANTIQLNTGNFDVNGPADVSGPTNLQSTLTVAGTTTSNGDLTVNANSDLNGTLDVSGNTDIDGTLDAQGATNLQSTLTVAGTTTSNGDLTVNANSDLNGTLDVSGNTDIDGTLDVQGATNLQSTLVVAGTTTSNGDLTVNANSDLNGTADVEGDFSVNTDKFVVTAASGNTAIAGTTTSEGDLTVNANSDLNGTLNVEGDATFQEDVIVEDNVFTNTAGNAGTVFTIHNSQGAAAITVETSDDALAMGGSATTLTTPRLIVQEDANYNGDMTVSGSLSVTDNIISAAAPTSPNHMANKQYVDNAVLNAVYAPEAYSYDAIESVHPGDVIYYINGDLLLYATGQTDNYNYVIQLTGSKLNDTDVTGAKLFARGNELNLFTSPTTDWQWGTGDSDASFKVGYNHIHALAGNQVDGYVSCSLVLYDAAGNGHNSGLTLRFYLDELNPVATATTFTE